MSDFRLEMSSHLTGVWKQPKFSPPSIRTAIRPTEFSFVMFPVALSQAFKGYHSSSMCHQNQWLFSTGRDRDWRSVSALGTVAGTSNTGPPITISDSLMPWASWVCFTDGEAGAPRGYVTCRAHLSLWDWDSGHFDTEGAPCPRRCATSLQLPKRGGEH